MRTPENDVPWNDDVVHRFARYLNGPKGRSVMDHIDEGESFIVQTAECTLRVTKIQGRAQVSNIEVAVQ